MGGGVMITVKLHRCDTFFMTRSPVFIYNLLTPLLILGPKVAKICLPAN